MTETNELTTADLDRLDALAAAATPGKWESERGYVMIRHSPRDETVVCDVGGGDEADNWDNERFGANGDYIAAVAPDIVRALVAGYRRMLRLEEAAAPLAELDWCIGYEITSEVASVFDEVRTRIYALEKPDAD